MQPWEQPGSGLTRRGPHGTRDTGWGSKGWKVPDFRRLYLLWSQVSGFPSVGPDVLLEDQGIGILFVADGALMEHPHGGLGPVDPHVGLQVALGGEGP